MVTCERTACNNIKITFPDLVDKGKRKLINLPPLYVQRTQRISLSEYWGGHTHTHTGDTHNTHDPKSRTYLFW